MSQKVLKIKKGLLAFALASMFLVPSATLAQGHHHGRGWFRAWWNGFFSGWNAAKQHYGVGVPEFSAGTAAGAIALLLGGTWVLVDRKRKTAL